MGDTEQGEDRLGVETIAEVLAETLVFADLEPPFVLGILGEWGRGKSYFFNLMLDHIIGIQKKPVDQVEENTFAGHIYVIKFDAWTFSRGEILSSFMYQILKTLNEQLQFEETMTPEALQAGEISTIEVFRDLTNEEIQYLEEDRDEILRTIKTIKKEGDSASHRLLKAININYDEEQKKLKDIEDKIEIQKRASCAVRDIERIIGETALDDINGIRDLKSLIEDIKSISWYNKFRFSNIPSIAIFCSTLLLILAIVFSLKFGDKISSMQSAIVAIPSGLFSAVLPVIASISETTNKIKPVIAKLNQDQAANDEDLEAGECTSLLGSDRLEKLKNQKAEIENRAFAIKDSSLYDTIKEKIDSKQYEGNLGIEHKVQQDLQRMSDGLLNTRNKQSIFPRGAPRIVLFVDDLDRCEAEVVEEVIKALQLLVKTKLFVTVLAIDPRYVTPSLEKHPDFLEKLIQIPFRLPGVGIDAISSFVDSQTEIEESQNSCQNDAPSADTFDDPFLQNQVSFTQEEKTMMEEIFNVFRVDPRCMRRIINVSKVIKVILKRSAGRFEVNDDLEQATFFLMLLSSSESTRDVTYRIFDWMERGAVTYHHVITENNLANLFKSKLLKSDKSFESSFCDQNQCRQGTLMAYIEKYLTKYKWSSIEGWDEIASKFLLARSFCFFHLVVDNDDARNGGESVRLLCAPPSRPPRPSGAIRSTSNTSQ